jgi:hypothetical protein
MSKMPSESLRKKAAEHELEPGMHSDSKITRSHLWQRQLYN